jgi:hypothetical protein
MAFDDLLYFREGAVAGKLGSNTMAGSCTSVLAIRETPVAGLGINVVVPNVASSLHDKLTITVYESDSSAWSTMVLFKTLPAIATAGSWWNRLYSKKDYLAAYYACVSASTTSVSVDFGAVDVRLTDRFAKYAGQ